MSIRNFGMGSRDIKIAGYFVLKKDIKSYSSIDTIHYRWNHFCDWLDAKGIITMEKITRDHVLQYGCNLANLVDECKLKPATAQNYVSAVNRVLAIARQDQELWVSPTQDCEIPERNYIAKISKSIPPEEHTRVKNSVSNRLSAMLDLMLTFGLRFEESAKINATEALEMAVSKEFIRIYAGTKGGRARTISIHNDEQIAALQLASEIQGRDRSMIPANQTYAEFQRACYRESTLVGVRFHSFRHGFAQNRYYEILTLPCPVQAGVKHGREHITFLSNELNISKPDAYTLDIDARLVIARELGHNRVNVTNSYLG